MKRLYLRVRAPFAAFRGLEAGDYLSTAPTITYSAAWGLLLNLAGIETRLNGSPTTLVRPDAPPLRIAIGSVKPSHIGSLYQQLHIYRVGTDSKEDADRIKNWPCKSYKHHIRPCRREVLIDFDVQLAVEGDSELLDQIVKGITDGLPDSYGLPFLGDNNFLIDVIDILEVPREVRWYERLSSEVGPREASCRLTVGIDRSDSSQTTRALVAPVEEPVSEPPEGSWFWVPVQASAA